MGKKSEKIIDWVIIGLITVALFISLASMLGWIDLFKVVIKK